MQVLSCVSGAAVPFPLCTTPDQVHAAPAVPNSYLSRSWR